MCMAYGSACERVKSFGGVWLSKPISAGKQLSPWELQPLCAALLTPPSPLGDCRCFFSCPSFVYPLSSDWPQLFLLSLTTLIFLPTTCSHYSLSHPTSFISFCPFASPYHTCSLYTTILKPKNPLIHLPIPTIKKGESDQNGDGQQSKAQNTHRSRENGREERL